MTNFLLLILIISPLINSQILLSITKSNLFENDIKYSCKLSIKELENSSNNINYIVFNFQKESKEKRNEIYISNKLDETMNSKTVYKLALFGSNKIIIPYDYAKKSDYLYIQINCYKNKKCTEEIIINLYSKIIIEDGETLYINGYKENYIYNFVYKYKYNKNNKDIIKQISANSYNKEDFGFEIKNNKTDIKKILNGFLYYITNEQYAEYNEKSENNIDIDILIKIIRPSSYITIQIISIDNSQEYNSIELYRPIIGLLGDTNKERCFYIDIKEKNKEKLFIDFMIEDETASLIYEDKENSNNNIVNLSYSQTIKGSNKFCISNFYSNMNHNIDIFFYFSVYYSDTKPHIRNKSYLGLLYNGYLYKKKLSENNEQMEYFPSEYNDYLLYFYINIFKGIISIDHIITNNFPYTKDKIEDKNYKNLNINKIGNEYFGTILIKENNQMSSSPMNPNKNILSIDCDSGIDDLCEFNIMFYTQNDVIHLRKNEKFSFLNYDKAFNDDGFDIKLNIDIAIPLFEINNDGEGNENKDNNYKLVIDTYSQLGSSYIELEHDYDSFYSNDIKTFYNDNLISKEIVFDYNKINDKTIENINKIKYQFTIISEDYDFVSIIISGTNNRDKMVESRLWSNGYLLTTLTKRIPQKKLIIDNLNMYYTMLNYYRTFFIFKYINCNVKTVSKAISKDKIELKDKIDNVSYMIIYKYLNESIDKYEFVITLDNIFDNEPVCMVYFCGFFIDDLVMSTQYPIFIKEDTEIPVIFLEYSTNGYNYEYLILNFYSPIIITISFEQSAEISLTYIFSNKDINPKRDKKEIIFHYSRSIIISSEEIRKNCLFNPNINFYRDNPICKLQLQIKQKSENNFQKLLTNLKIRMNNNKPVSYLTANTLTNGLILSGKFRYYYANLRQNDSGYIVLNHKKGIGIMYARILNKNTYDNYEGEKWNGRIRLLSREQIEKCKDCLINDINTNEIRFSEEHTKNCNSDLRCQIIIGVIHADNLNEKDDNNVYEYSIYLIKNNKNEKIYGNLQILSNENIQGTIYYNDEYYVGENNSIKYNYLVHKDVENIKYELQCNKCNLYLILDDKKILQKFNKEKIDEYNSNIVQFGNDDIHLFYNKIIQFEIKADEYDENNYVTVFFKINLLFKNSNKYITLLNSESNTICYHNCEFLLPIFDYDKLKSLTMSLSDIYLTNKVKTELQFVIYDSLDYYNSIMSNENENKNYIEKINSNNKNYIIYNPKETNKNKNILIKANIKILNKDNDKAVNNYYLVHFTFNKQSHKNYYIYPNRINLINIEKNDNNNNNNNDNITSTLKEIKFPDYFQVSNYQNKNEENFSSIIKFSHIKGKGTVNLVTNNLYLSSKSNIYIPYKELKPFIIDYYHSFLQINYNYKSRFSNNIGIVTNEDLYLYSTMTTNLYTNINEIKLGKTNYILHQYNSFILFYLNIEDISQIKNNIFINIKLEGLEIYTKYNWFLTGYFIKNSKIKEIMGVLDTSPVSIGYYDDVLNIGILEFNAFDMMNFYNDNNELVLLIKLFPEIYKNI